MNYKYGNFSDEQINYFKTQLHKKIHWLILYKDPNTCSKYEYVEYDKYFITLMKEIDALNELLFYPVQIIELTCLLQAAYMETKKNDFNYSAYRKLVLDAHNLVDRICEE